MIAATPALARIQPSNDSATPGGGDAGSCERRARHGRCGRSRRDPPVVAWSPRLTVEICAFAGSPADRTLPDAFSAG
jgi:hypothetical protein